MRVKSSLFIFVYRIIVKDEKQPKTYIRHLIINTLLLYLTSKRIKMNVIKRTGVVILMVIAFIASSCNKNSNDAPFYIGSKLDVFAAHFKGVVALTIDMAFMKDTITHLQKTITTLPETSSILALKNGLNTIKGRNDSIVSTLNVMAFNGTTTKAVIDSLKADLMVLSSKVSADNVVLTTQISTVSPTNLFLLARLNELLKNNTALVVQIASAQKSLNNLTAFSGDTATQTSVDVLRVQMNCAKVSFDTLLATCMP